MQMLGLSWVERFFTHSGALAEVMRGYLSAGLTPAPLMMLSPRVPRACGAWGLQVFPLGRASQRHPSPFCMGKLRPGWMKGGEGISRPVWTILGKSQ